MALLTINNGQGKLPIMRALLLLTLICFSYQMATAQKPQSFGKTKHPSLDRKAFLNEKAIVNGEKVRNILEIPWQVAVRSTNGSICGGSVIGDHWVITAAHCLLSLNPKKKWADADHFVISGSTNIRIGRMTAVEKFIPHPDFIHKNPSYDIALLKLTEKITTSDGTVQAIALSQKADDVSEGTPLKVSGWGRMDEEEKKLKPTNLLQTHMPTANQKDCEDSLPFPLGDHTFCGTRRDRSGICLGDSGGPAAVLNPQGQYILAGISAWLFVPGEDNTKICSAPNGYSGFTRISYFYNWIQKTMSANP